jgi:hypothetical protein
MSRAGWGAGAVAAALLVGTAAAPPAGALLSGVGPRALEAGENITVFHNIDMVTVSGYGPAGSVATVEVVRAGVRIGRASGPTVSGPEGIGLEVNHAPPGVPVPGDCWEGSIPDIRPGDRIVVTHAGDVDEVTVDGIGFTGAPVLEGPEPAGGGARPVLANDAPAATGNRVVVHGVALRADGTPIPVAALDGGEFRDGQYRLTPQVVETDSVGGFALVYPFPYNGNIKSDGRGEQARQDALVNPAGLHMAGFGHAAPPPPEAMMVEGFDDVPTVALGCTNPVATDAITQVTPDSVNIAARDAEAANPGGELVVSGVARDASAVSVRLDDADAVTDDALQATAVVTDAPDAGRPGSQLWTAKFPLADVVAAGLAEGSLTLTATLTHATAPATVRTATLLKDLTAPAAPTADLPSGSYYGTQRLTLGAADQAQETVHYTTAAGTPAAPTAADPIAPVAPGTLAVAASQTVHAAAVDRAGNVGAVLARTYTILPITAPDAPTAVQATAGAAQAVVTWAAPAANGSPITGYEVSWSGGGASGTRTVTASPATVTGLTNGTGYTFQVAARNAVNLGPASAPTAAVTPVAAPDAPTISVAVAGDGWASVSWTPPRNTGGAPIQGYLVRTYLAGSASVVGEQTVGADVTRHTVSGLVNGTAYQFEVRAANGVGEGPSTGRSNTVTPVAAGTASAGTVPDAPTVGRPARGNASVSVTWAPPATTGGGPVTEYRVEVFRSGVLVMTVAAPATSRTARVTGLRNGTAYTFRVVALNVHGASAPSAHSARVVPATVASAPRVGKAVAGKRGGRVDATARWAPPVSAGGSAVTGYQVVAERIGARGKVVGTTTSPKLPASTRAYAMRLKAGSYRFRVVALNAVGKSARSARSNAVVAR